MKYVKELIPYVVIVVVVVLIRTFIATPVRVDGPSMEPTLYNNQVLILNKLASNYERFDIVVINVNGKKIVKRIIGLPGESIEYIDNQLYINGEEYDDVVSAETKDFSLKSLYGLDTIPDDYYFVMGDNRTKSSDSRDYRIGLIKKDQIIGEPIFRIWPITKFGFIK